MEGSHGHHETEQDVESEILDDGEEENGDGLNNDEEQRGDHGTEEGALDHEYGDEDMSREAEEYGDLDSYNSTYEYLDDAGNLTSEDQRMRWHTNMEEVEEQSSSLGLVLGVVASALLVTGLVLGAVFWTRRSKSLATVTMSKVGQSSQALRLPLSAHHYYLYLTLSYYKPRSP